MYSLFAVNVLGKINPDSLGTRIELANPIVCVVVLVTHKVNCVPVEPLIGAAIVPEVEIVDYIDHFEVEQFAHS